MLAIVRLTQVDLASVVPGCRRLAPATNYSKATTFDWRQRILVARHREGQFSTLGEAMRQSPAVTSHQVAAGTYREPMRARQPGRDRRATVLVTNHCQDGTGPFLTA